MHCNRGVKPDEEIPFGVLLAVRDPPLCALLLLTADAKLQRRARDDRGRTC
ncbi:MAG TPA: hypothetical protein VMT03_08705 [Polyangia bacterium]|nr:hypothetical protein [Polyangia bacterium]